MRAITPIIIILISIACFIWIINPTYHNIQTLNVQVGQYNEALANVDQLAKIRDTLIDKRNSFSTADIASLQTMLPDNVDNIRLLVDLQGVASRYGMVLQGLQVASQATAPSTGNSSSGGPAAAATNPTGVVVTSGTTAVSFSVTTTYDNLILFLQDLEKSLRLVEVSSLTFKADKTNQYSVALKVNTYWLQNGTAAVMPVQTSN